MYDPNYFLHIGMEAWACEVIIYFVVCFQTTYFCSGGSVETGAWGHERGDGSNFLMMTVFKKRFSSYDSND